MRAAITPRSQLSRLQLEVLTLPSSCIMLRGHVAASAKRSAHMAVWSHPWSIFGAARAHTAITARSQLSRLRLATLVLPSSRSTSNGRQR